MSWKRRSLVVQGLVSIILLVLLVRGLDLASLAALFTRLPLWFYLLSLSLIVTGQVLYAWRWRLLLDASGVRVPWSVAVRQYFIGIFVNNFLPSTVGGDVAKVYLLGRDHGYRAVTASVVLDRALGVGLLALLAAAALWAQAMPGAILEVARLAVTGVAFAALLFLAIVATGTGGLARRVSWMGRHAAQMAERLHGMRSHMAAGLRMPSVIAQATAVVAAYALAVGGIYALFIHMQTGAVPPFGLLVAVVMATTVLSNVPISLNGLGLREQLHAQLLAPLGVPREVAVAISLLLFGHLLVASLLGLVFWLRAPVLPAEAGARLGA